MKSVSNPPKSFEEKIDKLCSNKAFEIFVWAVLIGLIFLTYVITQTEFGTNISLVLTSLYGVIILAMSEKIAGAKRISNRDLTKRTAFISGILEATAFWTMFLIINFICYKTYQGFMS